MKKAFLLVTAAFCFTTAFTQQNKPKLVVGVVVDQMRYDYLHKYRHNYSDDGLMRFYSEGFVMENHHFNYMPTFTGPGHASVFTGTTPAMHGIIGNSRYDKNTDQSIYCVADSTVSPVGSNPESDAARRSPIQMNTTTFCDQWMLHTNKKAKVIGLALKDRAAILSAGHLADGAYWYDSDVAGFVTSSYYKNELPEWLTKFNNEKPHENYLSGTWDLLLGSDRYSEPDETPYEGEYNGWGKSIFPYNLDSMYSKYGAGIIKSLPFGNDLTTDVAIAAMEGEQLGKGDVADILTLSYSTPDIMGHQFGPHALEMHDMYVRFDRSVKRLLDYLEAEYGKDEVLVFLTSDHGAADVPMYAQSNTGYYNTKNIKNALTTAYKKAFNSDTILTKFKNFDLYLNRKELKNKNTTAEEVLEVTRKALTDTAGVYDVLSYRNIGKCELNRDLCERIRNGFHPERSGDLIIIPQAGYISSHYKSGGTTHGSPFVYDTHAPMLWWGAGIRRGKGYEPTVIPDIAVTVSSILGTAQPNGATGTIMKELFYID